MFVHPHVFVSLCMSVFSMCPFEPACFPFFSATASRATLEKKKKHSQKQFCVPGLLSDLSRRHVTSFPSLSCFARLPAASVDKAGLIQTSLCFFSRPCPRQTTTCPCPFPSATRTISSTAIPGAPSETTTCCHWRTTVYRETACLLELHTDPPAQVTQVGPRCC